MRLLKSKLFWGLVALALIAGAVTYLAWPKNTTTTAALPVYESNQSVTINGGVAVAPTPPTKAELLTLVNQERVKNGVAPLVEDPRLDTSAQEKADDMTTNHYYGHISPITGKQGYLYINTVGIYCKTDSENIDENTLSPIAVDAWIASPPHLKAMINPNYSLTGFGISNGSQPGYYYFVEHFCQQ